MIWIIIAIGCIIFACIEGYKTWGVYAPIAIGIVGAILIMFVPFGSIISIAGGIMLFYYARSTGIKKFGSRSDDD